MEAGRGADQRRLKMRDERNQVLEFVTATLAVLPRGLSGAMMQRWIEMPVAERSAALRSVLISPWPKPGEVFQLTINGDASECDPIQMVCSDGYNESETWKHNGFKVEGQQTRRFKLVEVGYQPTFDAVQAELKKHGKIPRGQWREALKKNFPDAPGRPVGISDASWVLPCGDPNFPFVNGDGGSNFDWAGGDFSEAWLWLVEVDNK